MNITVRQAVSVLEISFPTTSSRAVNKIKIKMEKFDPANITEVLNIQYEGVDDCSALLCFCGRGKPGHD